MNHQHISLSSALLSSVKHRVDAYLKARQQRRACQRAASRHAMFDILGAFKPQHGDGLGLRMHDPILEPQAFAQLLQQGFVRIICM